jgi:hypothetical protein
LIFGLTGIAAALRTLLAAGGIPVMISATYDTDCMLIRQEQLIAQSPP